ncbi:unnamed protein product [Closterium sp. NIES-64]|nr:unnamed protein product [Closterium sp. NIES-64]
MFDATYAFEWPILNNAPDGKLSGKWEYNRIQYEEMCTRVKQEVEIAVMDHGVPYASNTNTFNFPTASTSTRLTWRPLSAGCSFVASLTISSVPFPFLPSLPSPSPSSHLFRPLPPVSIVPFLPSPMPLCAGSTTCTSPGCHPQPVITEIYSSTRGTCAEGLSSGSSNLQQQQGDRCGGASQWQ